MTIFQQEIWFDTVIMVSPLQKIVQGTSFTSRLNSKYHIILYLICQIMMKVALINWVVLLWYFHNQSDHRK